MKIEHILRAALAITLMFCASACKTISQKTSDSAISVSGPLAETETCTSQLTDAQKLMDSGSYKEALAIYTEAITSCNEKSNAYAFRAAAYSKIRNHEAALADCDQAIALDPANVTAYMNRCCEYVDLKNARAALQDGNTAVRLNAEASSHTKVKQEQALMNRGRAHGMLGDYKSALLDFDQAISLRPDYAVAYHNRAGIYLSLNNQKQAREDFQKAADQYADNGFKGASSDCLSAIAKLDGATQPGSKSNLNPASAK